MNSSQNMEKRNLAIDIVKSCIGSHGVYADPTRYNWQCWTRDFGIAILPVIPLKERDIARKHLEHLSGLQRENGQIPILFIDPDHEKEWVDEKQRKSAEQGRPSFMLSRYQAGELWNLTPGTRDSEIIYIIAMHEYAASLDAQEKSAFLDKYKNHIDKALGYIETVLLQPNGLVKGCDWRDTMEAELGEKQLLTNNCLLYKAYVLLGLDEKAARLKGNILRQFCPEGKFLDYLPVGPNGEGSRPDPLGLSFAVLFGIADELRHFEIILSQLKSVDSPCGVTIQCKHNPLDEKEKAMIERTNGVVVWPFIVGFTILALQRMVYGRSLSSHEALRQSARDFMYEQFDKLRGLDGFREYYDPADGSGYGALKQTWSAALYIRAMGPVARLQ